MRKRSKKINFGKLFIKMFPFQQKRVAARKLLLNREDIIRFDEVPDFIVDAFFGSCTFHKRLLTATFGFVNGISIDQLLGACRWNDTKQTEKEKMKKLYIAFESAHYQETYYSYNVHYKLVMFLNGDLRKCGKRVSKKEQ